MVPVISIVGKSNSGKTTFIERVIPILKEKGYRVGAIKHDAHRFDIDHEGKDTWRMTASGADTVAISSSSKMAMIKRVESEKSLDEIINALFQEMDIVITEGYKSQDKPKIEIVRCSKMIALPTENLIAAVNNMQDENFQLPEGYEEVQRFSMENIDEIAGFIEERFLKGLGCK